MKTKTLLFSAAALLAVSSVNAANDDVTPSHFKFSEKEVGPYEFFSILTRAQILEITRTMN